MCETGRRIEQHRGHRDALERQLLSRWADFVTTDGVKPSRNRDSGFEPPETMTRAELKATTLRALTHPDDVDLDADSLRELLDGRTPSYQVEKRYRHAWGHYVWGLLTVSLVRDDRGKALHLVSQVQDISERKELARRLEYLTDHDFLTGLVNRRRFEQELSREAERVARYGAPGAVLVIDLDNFKDVNELSATRRATTF